jgi:hypothetical protein
MLVTAKIIIFLEFSLLRGTFFFLLLSFRSNGLELTEGRLAIECNIATCRGDL